MRPFLPKNFYQPVLVDDQRK